eukprot:Hpha_TRINITY_DN11956_c0_g1::TRINITY_DN11956_c0_g1_i2::g.20624::m.20624
MAVGSLSLGGCPSEQPTSTTTRFGFMIRGSAPTTVAAGGPVWGAIASASVGVACEVELTDNFKLGLLLLILLGAVLLVAVVGLFLSNAKTRRYRKLYDDAKVAEDMASQIQHMELDKLSYLETIEYPTKTQQAFRDIVRTLWEYKAYIPKAVLPNMFDDVEGGRASVVPAPGASAISPMVAMVFTDIENSTGLWEICPEATYAAVGAHNELMRDLAELNDGYEVKIIGDAFMLAFGSVIDGMRFALQAQEGLLSEDWEPDLLSTELCKPRYDSSGTKIWGGLRVRIGINWGAVRVEENAVTHRFDYFGSTVNTAARVEGALRQGGLIGVTAAVKDIIRGHEEELGDPVVFCLNNVTLKGVAETVDIVVYIPSKLAERESILQAGHSDSLRSQQGTPPLRRSSSLGSTLSEESRTSQVGRGSTTSQVGRGSTTRSVEPNPLSRLAVHLKVGRASVVCKRFHTVESADLLPEVQAGVFLAERSALSTRGQIGCLFSMFVIVSWNCSRPCFDHPSCAAAFIGLVIAGQNKSSSAGAMSGRCHAGNLASKWSRFATVIGAPVELAMELASAARQEEFPAMVAGAVATELAAGSRAYRVQLWHLGSRDIVVWAVEEREEKGFWHLYEAAAADGAMEMVFHKWARGDPVPDLPGLAGAGVRGASQLLAREQSQRVRHLQSVHEPLHEPTVNDSQQMKISVNAPEERLYGNPLVRVGSSPISPSVPIAPFVC